MQRSRPTLALLAALACHAPAALAGYRVEQRVTSALDGKSHDGQHVWLIDDGKFSLSVQTPRGEALYLFNGRNFYVCGKLDAGDRGFLGKNRLKADELVQKFKNGACQAVPSNFMARFFVAQALAAESLDRSDGMQVTLAIESYSVSAASKDTKIAGTACKSYSRHYTLSKRTESGGSYALSADEELCSADDVEWRGSLWTEVAKSIMRQPGGTRLLAALKKDRDGLKGFPLSLQSRYELKTPDGKAHRGSVTAKATSVKKLTTDSTSFKLPNGYQIFAPESADIPALAAGSPVGKDQAKTDQKSGAEEFLQAAQSVFLCAISSSLGCVMTD